jgi:hypothetical protein
MEKFEQLSNFIDGELSAADEQKLFYRIAADDELRREFKNMITVGQAIKNNSDRFSPPAAATANIFNSLGYKPASSASIVSSETGSVAGFLTRNSRAIFSAAASALITALVMLMILPGTGGVSSSDSFAYIHSEETPTHIEMTIPAIENYSANNDNTDSAKNINTMIDKSDSNMFSFEKNTDKKSGNYSTIVNDFSNIPEYNKNNRTKISRTDLASVQKLNLIPDNKLFGNEKTMLAINNIPTAVDIAPKLSTSEKPLRISMEYRGSQYWFIPEPAIYPAKFAKFNNNAITLFYLATENLSIGPELRQENFYQEFTGVDELGKETIYKQQPNFTSFGVAVRYALKDVGIVHPVGQFTLGGNKSGAIGRMMAGIVYNPTPNVSFIIGGEYSIMMYNHQNNLFKSQKFGLNYGVAYNF